MNDTVTRTDLSTIYRRVIRARLGMLEDANDRYAEDVATLLAALKDAQLESRKAKRSIRIEERLRLK